MIDGRRSHKCFQGGEIEYFKDLQLDLCGRISMVTVT